MIRTANRITITALAAMLVLLAAASSCRLKDEATPGTASVPAPPDVSAPPADALRTPSGLASKVLRVGFGQARPSATSWVTVNYTGWKSDGTMFDTNQGVEFQVNQLVTGLREGLPLMTIGEKRRFWIPSELAYNDGMRVFDIELLRVR